MEYPELKGTCEDLSHGTSRVGRDPPGSSTPTPDPAQDIPKSHPVPESVVQALPDLQNHGIIGVERDPRGSQSHGVP